jgi:hypothetical protein
LTANPRQVRLTSSTSHSKMAHPAKAKKWWTIRASLSSLEADSSSSSSSHANNQSRLSSHSIAKDPICNRTRTKDSPISRTFRISDNSQCKSQLSRCIWARNCASLTWPILVRGRVGATFRMTPMSFRARISTVWGGALKETNVCSSTTS